MSEQIQHSTIIYIGHILGWMLAAFLALVGFLVLLENTSLGVIILLAAGLIAFSLLMYNDTFRDASAKEDKAIADAKQDRNKERQSKIDALLAEIDQLNSEMRQNYRIIDENKKAVFGAKAKAWKTAEAKIKNLETIIEEKTKEAQKIKKSIEQ